MLLMLLMLLFVRFVCTACIIGIAGRRFSVEIVRFKCFALFAERGIFAIIWPSHITGVMMVLRWQAAQRLMATAR